MMEISVEQYNKMAERLTELEYELDKSVKVVRCKDCKKASTTGYLYCTNDGIAECQSVYCGHYKIYMELNHYCSYGERRE